MVFHICHSSSCCFKGLSHCIGPSAVPRKIPVSTGYWTVVKWMLMQETLRQTPKDTQIIRNIGLARAVQPVNRPTTGNGAAMSLPWPKLISSVGDLPAGFQGHLGRRLENQSWLVNWLFGLQEWVRHWSIILQESSHLFQLWAIASLPLSAWPAR